MKTSILMCAAVVSGLSGLGASVGFGAELRSFGVDVSEYQGTINWTTVANSTFDGGKEVDFAFIRASRGSNPNTGASTLYTDTNFARNITNAKAAGLMVAPYHFARPDLNSAVSEAQYFLNVAGNYMTTGYLRPVLDLEAGSDLSRTALTDWAIAFCNEIVRVKGVNATPIIYLNTSYATDEVDSRMRNYPLWIARPAGSIANATSWDMQTRNPTISSSVYSQPYGVWQTTADPNPWSFWQYYIPENASEYTLANGYPYINVPGIPAKVDLDVVNNLKGGLSAFLIPEPSGMMALMLPGAMLMARRRRA